MEVADVHQERTADYRVFDLAGSHYQIGQHMGRITRLREVESWRDRDTELAFAQACADVVGSLHPPLLDEMRGYAAAQGLRWDEVLAHCSLNLPEGTLSGCTTFAWRLPGGGMIVGRNYDFLYDQKQRYLRRLAPTGCPASLGMQAGLLGSCYDGVNAHGVFAASHLIRAERAERVPPGVPFHLMARIALETCRTACEAADRILAMPHLFPFNYLVADAHDMLAVEAYPGRVRLRAPAGEWLVVTNYYQLAEQRPLHGRRRLDTQIARVQWLEERLANSGVTSTQEGWAWAQQVLHDHAQPMCHHRPTQATLWSVVADLTTRRIAYCLGAPCRNEYQEYRWPE